MLIINIYDKLKESTFIKYFKKYFLVLNWIYYYAMPNIIN